MALASIPDLLDIAVEPQHDSGVCLVSLAGVLDVTTSAWLREAVAAAPRGSEAVIIIDMRALRYIDSAGLGALIAAQKSLAPDGQVKLVIAGGIIERLLQITGLIATFEAYATLEDAKQGRRRLTSI